MSDLKCPHGHAPYDECPLCHAMVDAIREAAKPAAPVEWSTSDWHKYKPAPSLEYDDTLTRMPADVAERMASYESEPAAQAEPREWHVWIDRILQTETLKKDPVGDLAYSYEDVPVIEKSAYDALKAERDVGRSVITDISEKNAQLKIELHKLRAEIEKLKAERDMWKSKYHLKDEDLPDCPRYIAHPQSVWFHEHWRPRFIAMKAEAEKLRAELAEAKEKYIRSENGNEIEFLKEERDEARAELAEEKRQHRFTMSGADAEARAGDEAREEVERLKKYIGDYEYHMPEIKAERKLLKAALMGLLADTQHAEHNCGEPDCPVEVARKALRGEGK